MSILIASGCAARSGRIPGTVASYQPSNVYSEGSALPRELKRVAVLPVNTLTDAASMEFGRDSLRGVLLDALGQARLFELVVVSPQELRVLTGRSYWSDEDALPFDFFERLKEKLGVDGVLFTRLTHYRPYSPVAVGWRLKLLDAEEPRVLWAVDELFDARIPEVAAAARRYARHNPETSQALANPEGVFVSPRRFAQYTANALVNTCPGRASHDE